MKYNATEGLSDIGMLFFFAFLFLIRALFPTGEKLFEILKFSRNNLA